jgi:hypothetical protein
LPAVDFLSFVKTTDGKSNTKITDQQREICDKLRKIKIGSPEDIGQSLLPNETRTFPTFKVRKLGRNCKRFSLPVRSTWKISPSLLEVVLITPFLEGKAATIRRVSSTC